MGSNVLPQEKTLTVYKKGLEKLYADLGQGKKIDKLNRWFAGFYGWKKKMLEKDDMPRSRLPARSISGGGRKTTDAYAAHYGFVGWETVASVCRAEPLPGWTQIGRHLLALSNRSVVRTRLGMQWKVRQRRNKRGLPDAKNLGRPGNFWQRR